MGNVFSWGNVSCGTAAKHLGRQLFGMAHMDASLPLRMTWFPLRQIVLKWLLTIRKALAILVLQQTLW